MPKALIALTSYYEPFYEDGAKTGLFFVEALHPYHVFKKAGIELTFVSETGTFGWDDHSIGPEFLQGDDRKVFEDPNSDFMKAIQHVKKASEVDAKDYDLIFVAGGHGTIFDFPHATALQSIVRSLYEQGKVVSSVCHGLTIFENLRLTNGKYLIEGKQVTGFTDEGEVQIGLTELLKKRNLKTPQDIAKECGATFALPNGPWDSFAVLDGNLVTGVNPQSSVETAQKAIALLGL